jgi:chaperonin GroES
VVVGLLAGSLAGIAMKGGGYRPSRATRSSLDLVTVHGPDEVHNRKEEERMKIRPLHDRILVTRVAEQEVGRGGIIIPDTAKEKPQEGKVVAVGNGKVTDDGKRIALDVQAGDRILFGKYSGSEVKIEDDEYVIMREEDVFAILD